MSDQEPVAWYVECPTNGDLLFWTKREANRFGTPKPLYDHHSPPVEAEPFGYFDLTADVVCESFCYAKMSPNDTPVYLHPATPAPVVTDEMVERAVAAWHSCMGDQHQSFRAALEAALGERK